MVLVDTSILISFFRGMKSQDTEKFENLIIKNIL
jgi:hypothetical protein